ncbi:hypothetical protein Tco_0907682 [Tanacetum coccineum]|uniref:BED-type domain-containing protein n=1 Tax=Tanacetum coccineum TaxID=301880 RepID=A0ABQ5CMT3_9ASTR
MTDNSTKAQCKHCFHFLSAGSNSTLRNHINHPHCEALKTVPEAGQSSMSRDESVFVYNPDAVRERFAGLVIQESLPFNHFDNTRMTRVFQNHLQWEKCNSIMLYWLLNSVSKDLFLSQIFSDNASKVWAELKETYDKLDGSIILNLLQKIHNFKQGELTLIRSSLLSRETLPDVKDAFAIISREESYRGIASSSRSVPKPQVTSFVSRIKISNNSNNGNKRFDNRRVNHSKNNVVNTSGNNSCKI